MNKYIVQKNLENKQKEWLMPPNLKKVCPKSDIISHIRVESKTFLPVAANLGLILFDMTPDIKPRFLPCHIKSNIL
jgi:hypothetical protein